MDLVNPHFRRTRLALSDGSPFPQARQSGGIHYTSIENIHKVIDALQYGQITLGQVTDPIQVSIGQFYGIEINDFAVTVAKAELDYIMGNPLFVGASMMTKEQKVETVCVTELMKMYQELTK